MHDKENNSYENKWISYGLIKKYINKDLSIKLDDAFASGLIIANKNNYKFSSNLTKNLALIALKYQITINIIKLLF